MRVLIVAPYIYKKEWPEFTRNRTGFGFMVNDIFESVSNKTETFLLTQVITKGHGNIIKHSWQDVIDSLRFGDCYKGFKYFFQYNQSLKNRLKYFYYAINAGTLRKAIRVIKPDVIHIHGIGAQTRPYIDICEEVKIPYIVTLHGLIGLDDSVNSPKWDKDMEKEFLINAADEGIPVTVISSGMKKRIESEYLQHRANNITVVCNGTKFIKEHNAISQSKCSLKERFNLKNERIAIVVGSICERKNQFQVLRALCTGLITTPCHIFLCGADTLNGKLQSTIDALGLDEKVHVMGFLPHEEIEQIMDEADLNIVASKDEGFGLSIIEAFSYGIPSTVFSDLDAIPDLYSEQAIVKVDGRSDEDLARGIEAGLSKKWDKKWIIEYSKMFSLDNMADNYMTEYIKCCKSVNGCSN